MHMAATTRTAEPAFGGDLTFTHQPRHGSVGGTWVIGLVAGHRFQALVFPAHAESPEYELGESQISKLWGATPERRHGGVQLRPRAGCPRPGRTGASCGGLPDG
jgi:hypothetical protein